MATSSHRVWRTATMHAPPFKAMAARGAALRPCDPSAIRALEGNAPTVKNCLRLAGKLGCELAGSRWKAAEYLQVPYPMVCLLGPI